MELLFLRNAEPGHERALHAIRDLGLSTMGVLKIAVAYFHHPEIANWILQRDAVGRETRLLVNSSDLLRPGVEYELSEPLMRVVRNSHMYGRLQARTLGLPYPNYHNMHHKFAVGDDRVLFGTVNWTTAALARNYEFFAVERAPAIVDHFDVPWERAHWLDGNSKGLRVIVCPHCKTAGSVDFESYGAHCTICGAEFRPAQSRW